MSRIWRRNWAIRRRKNARERNRNHRDERRSEMASISGAGVEGVIQRNRSELINRKLVAGSKRTAKASNEKRLSAASLEQRQHISATNASRHVLLSKAAAHNADIALYQTQQKIFSVTCEPAAWHQIMSAKESQYVKRDVMKMWCYRRKIIRRGKKRDGHQAVKMKSDTGLKRTGASHLKKANLQSRKEAKHA